MSHPLAISAAFSVLMMACFVLFGQGAAPAPVRHEALPSPISAAEDALPKASELLPFVR